MSLLSSCRDGGTSTCHCVCGLRTLRDFILRFAWDEEPSLITTEGRLCSEASRCSQHWTDICSLNSVIVSPECLRGRKLSLGNIIPQFFGPHTMKCKSGRQMFTHPHTPLQGQSLCLALHSHVINNKHSVKMHTWKSFEAPILGHTRTSDVPRA